MQNQGGRSSMGKKLKWKAERGGEVAAQPHSSGQGPSRQPVDATTTEATSEKKKRRLNNFARAKANFERIQEQRRNEAARKLEEKERRHKALESYLTTKKKMNKALSRKNRKGQPNLGAQVQVILEKLQKK